MTAICFDFGGKILSFELEFSELLLIAFLFKAILRKINQRPLDKCYSRMLLLSNKDNFIKNIQGSYEGQKINDLEKKSSDAKETAILLFLFDTI
jgi:hypothetical protein